MYTDETSRLGLLCVAELILDLNRCSAVFLLLLLLLLFLVVVFFFWGGGVVCFVLWIVCCSWLKHYNELQSS